MRYSIPRYHSLVKEAKELTWSDCRDSSTRLLGYKTWGHLNRTDPEVDSIFHTMYWFYYASIYNFKNSYNGRRLKEDFDKLFRKYKVKNGVFTRYPKPGQNYILGDKQDDPKRAHFNFPWNLSRDNSLPLIIALGEFGHSKEIAYFALRQILRFGCYQNFFTNDGERKFMPDYMFPDTFGVFVRAFYQSLSEKWLKFLLFPITYILLLFCDIFMVFAYGLHVLGTLKDPHQTGSELNFVSMAIQSQRVLPTPLSILAIKIYTKLRKRPTEVDGKAWEKVSESVVMDSLYEFFSYSYRAKWMAPMDHFTKAAVYKYLDSNV